uniref:Uncharacterized protein n=1 Tax=Amphimedon queenslandica TaxID=400682 RepID=A0A1X7VRE0_AMPQE
MAPLPPSELTLLSCVAYLASERLRAKSISGYQSAFVYRGWSVATAYRSLPAAAVYSPRGCEVPDCPVCPSITPNHASQPADPQVSLGVRDSRRVVGSASAGHICDSLFLVQTGFRMCHSNSLLLKPFFRFGSPKQTQLAPAHL